MNLSDRAAQVVLLTGGKVTRTNHTAVLSTLREVVEEAAIIAYDEIATCETLISPEETVIAVLAAMDPKEER